MKKFFLPLLAILLPAVFISCENFLSSNTEFREKISEEVKISTASSVNVVVLPKAGTGEVSKSAIEAKVGVPFMVQFFADENAEFLRWTAFSEYDETKTMDDQLGTTVVQYKNADNTNETGASFVKVEVTILKDIGQVTLVPWCGARPRVTTTEPVNYSTNVVRTTPIKIRFSKAIDESCISTKENPEIYKNYFELYQRDTANSDEKFIDLSKYFDAPVIKNEKEIWFNCKEKTDESKWLKAGSVIRFVVKGSLKDADGVRFDDTTSIEFTLGAKGDGTGPIIAISEFKNGTNDIHQTVFGNWEPRSGAAAGVYYADTDCRVSGSGSFSMKVKGDDSTTGDTGLMGFSVIQRLVYVPKGAYLPGTDDEKAASDMIPFDEGKTKWNYLSGILESDFKKETIFEYKSENTDFEKTFEIDEGFKTTSGKAVDGIYMFEVTALDGNSNYASNPCYYYVVRDTTAPDGKENAAKVKFTDDCGVAVNGKRFFGRNYRTVKFRIDGKITDSGTQGLPWTACKSEECRWYIALSSSDTELVPVVEWKAIAAGETSIQMEIPESYFADGAQDAVLYAWLKLEDDFGHMSNICRTSAGIYIDVESPVVTLEKGAEGVSLIYFAKQNQNDIVYSKLTDSDVFIKPEDGFSGKLFFGTDEENLQEIGYGENAPLMTIKQGNTYVVKCIDPAGNETSMKFNVENASGLSAMNISNEKIVDADFAGFKLENYYYNYRSDKPNDYRKTKEIYDIGNLTNGDIKLTFDVTDNQYGLENDGIVIDKVKVAEFTIRDADDNVIWNQKCDKTSGIVPLKREYTVGDISVEIIADVDKDQWSDGDNKLVVKVNNGFAEKEIRPDFLLDTTPPDFYIYNSAHEVPLEPVFKDGEWHVYYYTNSVANPHISVFAEQDRGLTYAQILGHNGNNYYTQFQRDQHFVWFEYNGKSFAEFIVQFSPFGKEEESVWKLHDIVGNSRKFKLHYLKDPEKPEILVDAKSDSTGNNYYYSANGDSQGVSLSFKDGDRVDNYVISSSVDGTIYGTNPKNDILLKGSPAGIKYTVTATDPSGNFAKKEFSVYECNGPKVEISKVYVKLPWKGNIPANGNEESQYTKTEVISKSYFPSRNVSILVKAKLPGNLEFDENDLEVIYYTRNNQSTIVSKKVKRVTLGASRNDVEVEVNLYDSLNSSDGISVSNNQIVLHGKDCFGNDSYHVINKPVDAYGPAAKIVSADASTTKVKQLDTGLYGSSGYGHRFKIYHTGNTPSFKFGELNDTYCLSDNELKNLGLGIDSRMQNGVGPETKIRWYVKDDSVSGVTRYIYSEDFMDVSKTYTFNDISFKKQNGGGRTYYLTDKNAFYLDTYDAFGNYGTGSSGITITFEKVDTLP